MLSDRLIDAIEQENLILVKKMLLDGCDPNIVENDSTGWSALHIAVEVANETGNMEIVKILIQYQVDVNKWNTLHTSTPLIVAVFDNNVEATKILLEADANPNVQSGQGDTPLRKSVEEQNYKIVKLLLDYGAIEDIDKFGGDSGLTPLGIATSKLDIKMIQLLIHAGANLDVLDDEHKIAQQRMPKYSVKNDKEWTTTINLLSA